MDPILVIVLVIFVVLVLVAVFARNQSRNGPNSNKSNELDSTFEFDQDMNTAAPTIGRRIRFVAPAQLMNGAMRKIQVVAQPLSAVGQVTIPPEKGIEALDILVMNPAVYATELNQEVYEFDPPLTVSIDLKSEDMQNSEQSGVSARSIYTGYKSDSGWRFERLETTTTPNAETGGTVLTAQLRTLHPQDPMWAGRP